MGRVMVDLASGPSGYFSPMLDALTEDKIFIVTPALLWLPHMLQFAAETFVAFCENVGFQYLGGDILHMRKGKISDGDLYPLDENDCSADRTVYFEKSGFMAVT